MKYWLLSITNKCDKACSYCAVKRWRNNPDFPDLLEMRELAAWLDDKLHEGDVCEVTGGEPTLRADLEYLLGFLKDEGCAVILRTNGIGLGGWRHLFPNMAVALAKHDSSESFIARCAKCLEPWDIVLGGREEVMQEIGDVAPKFRTDKDSPCDMHGFDSAIFVTADGKVSYMPCTHADKPFGFIPDCEIKDDSYACRMRCSYMLGAWNMALRIKDWRERYGQLAKPADYVKPEEVLRHLGREQ